MRARNRPIGRIASASGAVLLGTMLMLLTISLIGATLASFFLSVTTGAEVELYRAQALYLAEAGMAQAVDQIHRVSLMGGELPQQIGPLPLGEGEYQVIQDPAFGTITSIGRAHGVRRTIQMRYYTF